MLSDLYSVTSSFFSYEDLTAAHLTTASSNFVVRAFGCLNTPIKLFLMLRDMPCESSSQENSGSLIIAYLEMEMLTPK